MARPNRTGRSLPGRHETASWCRSASAGEAFGRGPTQGLGTFKERGGSHMALRSDGKVRVGVIGVGNIAQSAIIPAYLKQPDVELVAVCDINGARAAEVARKYNVQHVTTDFNELVALADVDAVSVCTWNNAHAPATIAALEAGSTSCAKNRRR